MATKAEAEQALYKAIIAGADEATRNKDAGLVKTLAESFREVAHGPQGGSYEDERRAFNENVNENTSTTTSDAKYDGSTTHDYHETHHHNGEERQPPGFGS